MDKDKYSTVKGFAQSLAPPVFTPPVRIKATPLTTTATSTTNLPVPRPLSLLHCNSNTSNVSVSSILNVEEFTI